MGRRGESVGARDVGAARACAPRAAAARRALAPARGRALAVLAVLIAGVLAPRRAAADPPPRLGAARTAASIRIDGRIDEAAWRAAPASDAFTQKYPDEGRAPTERTTVRVLYDDRALYVAIDCVQRTPVIRRLTRRDRQVEADRVTLDIDSRGSGASAFHFEVNAAGVQVDGLRYDDTELSLEWDEIWEAEARGTPRGWAVELRIPLRVLRFEPRPAQDWGLQIRRYISGRQEIDEWTLIPRDAAGEVSRYGRLGPLEQLRPRAGVELRPFVVGRLRRRDPMAGTLASGLDLRASAGLDARFRLTQDLTVDASVLPDFAQVEADQQVLNLTNFEFFYPEKRPVFLAGMDLFTTPLTVLYTRRIGRQPAPPELRTGETLVDVPDPIPIWGMVKLVGSNARGLTYGVLSALTGPGSAVAALSGAGLGRETRLVEPGTLFTVARARQSFGNRGHIGVIGAATLRLDPASYPALAPPGDQLALCPSGIQVAVGQRCFHDAFVGGIDARWRSPGGDYALAGQLVASAVHGGPTRTLPDGTTIGSNDVGAGLWLRAAKEGGNWRWLLRYEGYTPRLELNDLGYLQRQNLHAFRGELTYRDTRPGRYTLQTRYQLEVYQRRNFDWLDLAEGYQLNASATFRNFWTGFTEVHYRPAHFDDRELGNGVALERAGLWGWELELESDPRRPVVGSLTSTAQLLTNGYNIELSGRLLFKALPQLDLELLPEAVFTDGEPRYVGEDAPGVYRFGRQRAASLGLTLRATYTFTPRLTLQAYAQPFLASVEYHDFATIAPAGRVVRLGDLSFSAPAPRENPSYERAALNVNVVLRWEFLLGSTLYLVYTRSQAPTSMLAPGEVPQFNVAALGRGPATDVFFLKVSYWWG